MIGSYLNQIATWKRVTGYDGYGEPVYAESDIKVRWEGKRQLVRNKQGQEVVSEARAYCLEDVSPGDVLNYNGRDWTIITVSEVVDLFGQAVMREVAL